MNILMTRLTNSNNFQAVCFGVTRMVIFLCVLPATAREFIWPRQSARMNGVPYSGFSTDHVSMILSVTLAAQTSFLAFVVFLKTLLAFFRFVVDIIYFLPKFFTSLCLAVSLHCRFAFFGLRISFLLFPNTRYTYILMPIYYSRVARKFRQRFNSLAFSASFCLNWFRHFRFLNRRTCLGPLARTTLALGPFILTTPIFMSTILSERGET